MPTLTLEIPDQEVTHLRLAGLRPKDLVEAEGVLLAIHSQGQGGAALQAADRAAGVGPYPAEHTDLRGRWGGKRAEGGAWDASGIGA